MQGSTNTKKFKKFQIRWAEKLGLPDAPYLIRWTFIIFGFSIRIHHWIKSDDKRYYHDHSANLLSIVLYGRYWNVNPISKDNNPDDLVPVTEEYAKSHGGAYKHCRKGLIMRDNREYHYVEGIFNSWHNFFHMGKSIWFSKAEDRHYLDIPPGGAWTLMFEGRPRHKWGFYVNGSKWRPLRYFHKFGIIQDKHYQ